MKQSKANLVFLIVNNSGMEQVLVEYPQRLNNGHDSIYAWLWTG